MGTAAGKLDPLVRLALTGSALGPGSSALIHLIGRELVRRRIDDAVEHLSGA
jgi:hypothetical protein